MPFDYEEALQLQAAHPDSILLAVVKDDIQTVLLIPRAHKNRTIRFAGNDITLSMLHGGTYYIGGDQHGLDELGNPGSRRSVTADRIVPGDYFRNLLPVVDAGTATKKGGAQCSESGSAQRTLC